MKENIKQAARDAGHQVRSILHTKFLNLWFYVGSVQLAESSNVIVIRINYYISCCMAFLPKHRPPISSKNSFTKCGNYFRE